MRPIKDLFRVSPTIYQINIFELKKIYYTYTKLELMKIVLV